MSQRGRPKSKEELVSRSFDIPSKTNEDLINTSRRTGVNQVAIVREGLKKHLDEINGRTIDTPSEPLPFVEKISEAVSEALQRERERDALLVRLRDPDRERLEAVAEAIGYTEPADLVEDVMRTLLRRPEEITEMLLGQSVRALQQALEAEGQHEAAAAGRAEFRKLNERVSNQPAKKSVRKKAA